MEEEQAEDDFGTILTRLEKFLHDAKNFWKKLLHNTHDIHKVGKVFAQYSQCWKTFCMMLKTFGKNCCTILTILTRLEKFLHNTQNVGKLLHNTHMAGTFFHDTHKAGESFCTILTRL